MADEREHQVYVDEDGTEECIEECTGCHYEGNLTCEALPWGCDLCDPDGKHVDTREWSDDLLMGSAPH